MNRRQRAYSNGTLIIDQVQRNSDAGTYTCQAQNRQRHSARREVEVQVLGKLSPVYARKTPKCRQYYSRKVQLSSTLIQVLVKKKNRLHVIFAHGIRVGNREK